MPSVRLGVAQREHRLDRLLMCEPNDVVHGATTGRTKAPGVRVEQLQGRHPLGQRVNRFRGTPANTSALFRGKQQPWVDTPRGCIQACGLHTREHPRRLAGLEQSGHAILAYECRRMPGWIAEIHHEPADAREELHALRTRVAQHHDGAVRNSL